MYDKHTSSCTIKTLMINSFLSKIKQSITMLQWKPKLIHVQLNMHAIIHHYKHLLHLQHHHHHHHYHQKIETADEMLMMHMKNLAPSSKERGRKMSQRPWNNYFIYKIIIIILIHLNTLSFPLAHFGPKKTSLIVFL